MCSSRLFFNVLLVSIVLVSCTEKPPEEKKDKRIPVIYFTDVYHPHCDLDDYFDLAAMYAIDDFDIKAIVLDYAQPHKNPGIKIVDQMNHITNRNIPAFLGLKEKLKSPDDKGIWQSKYQQGVIQVMNILEKSEDKVTIFTVGSLRDLAATYNRDPNLFEKKVDKVICFLSSAYQDHVSGWNVALDSNAFIGVFNKIPNIYWVPCWDGYKKCYHGSYWKAHHADLLKNAPDELINYFLHAISRESDTVDYISYLSKPIDKKKYEQQITDSSAFRMLWCSSVFPYFSANTKNTLKTNLPFTFDTVKVHVNDTGLLEYSETGNTVFRFKITDTTDYGDKMTSIFNELITTNY